MVVDEDERPDNYRCQAVFENRSSFTVDLTKLTVSQTGVDEHLFEVEDVENLKKLLLNPFNQSLKSDISSALISELSEKHELEVNKSLILQALGLNSP